MLQRAIVANLTAHDVRKAQRATVVVVRVGSRP